MAVVMESKHVKEMLRTLDPLGDLNDETIELLQRAYFFGRDSEAKAQESLRDRFKRNSSEEARILGDDNDYLRRKVQALEIKIEELEGKK